VVGHSRAGGAGRMLSETDEDAINLHNPDSADTWTTQHTRMAESRILRFSGPRNATLLKVGSTKGSPASRWSSRTMRPWRSSISPRAGPPLARPCSQKM